MSENTNRRPPARRGGPGGGMVPGEKAKNFKGTMKQLGGYLKKYTVQLVFVLIFAVGSTVFNIIGPKKLGKATTELFSGVMAKLSGTGEINFDKIAQMLIFLICLYALSSVLSYVQGFIITGVAQKLTYNLRKEVSEKIHRMPMNYFDTKTHGETLSIITNDIDTLSTSLNQSASQLITSVVTVIGITVMMFSIDWVMTLITLLILPLSLAIIGGVMKKSQIHFKNQQEYLGHVNGEIEETFSGHTVVKAFSGEERAIKKFDEYNAKLYESAWKSQFFSGMMMPIMNFVGNLGYVGIAIVGGCFAISGRIAVGDILSFITYSKQFTQPIA